MLKQSPFYLKDGEEVVVKVTAYNNFGLGKSLQTTTRRELTPPVVSAHECVLKISWRDGAVQVKGR